MNDLELIQSFIEDEELSQEEREGWERLLEEIYGELFTGAINEVM